MHDIVTSHPEWQEMDAAMQKAAADAEAQCADADERMLAYNEGMRLAVEGNTAPPPPPQITRQHIGNVSQVERNRIDAKRKAWIQANLTDLAERAYEREDVLIERALDLITELEGIVAEENELQTTLRSLHGKAGNAGTPSFAGSNLELLTRAAKTGTRLMREPYVTQVHRL